ncbi:MAG: class A sortase [Anaerococcus sp.]
MKKKFFISFLLLAVGLFLAFLPKVGLNVTENRTEENAVIAEQIQSETLQANIKLDSEFDYDSILEIDPTQTLLNYEQADKNLIIGRLLIPSIDLNLSVYNGVSNPILNSGLGTMKPNLEMGKGNFPIVGHYSSDKEILFGGLYDINMGDLIYLTDNKNIYEYKVYDTKVVNPDEIEWIEDSVAEKHGKPIISLMNCYYVDGENTGKRYFVFAEFINMYEYSQEDINIINK